MSTLDQDSSLMASESCGNSSPSSTSQTSTLQYVSPYNKPEPCSISFRPALPSFTSLSLPAALSKPFVFSKYIENYSKEVSISPLYSWFQTFHFASAVITSRYNPEPPPTEIVCAMTEWQETETVSGLIVRAMQYNRYVNIVKSFRILYLLAFASKSFLLKMACVIGEGDNERVIASWLEKIPGAVEKSLSEGVPEETFFDTEHQRILTDAYERVMEMPDDGSYFRKLSIVNLPSLDFEVGDIFGSQDCQRMTTSQESIGTVESDDGMSDEEFWKYS
jgi:hypothetical protein